MIPYFKTALFVFALCIGSIHAHIDKSSLSIKGGETFKAGDKVAITWKISIFHSKPHIIYFSSAVDQSWQKIDSVPEKSGDKNMSYTWTVPQFATTSARIRIFQSFVSKPGEQTDDYTLVSKPFSITTEATPVMASPSTSPVKRNNENARAAVGYDLNGRKIDRGLMAMLRNGERWLWRIVAE